MTDTRNAIRQIMLRRQGAARMGQPITDSVLIGTLEEAADLLDAALAHVAELEQVVAAGSVVQEEAPCPWAWDGDVLRVGDRIVGRVGRVKEWWAAGDSDGKTIVMTDERTARAVVVALAGYDPGVTFVLSLRPDWTREDIDAARNYDLGCYLAGMLEGYAEDFDGQQHEDDPQVARRWWGGGYKALTIQAKERSDDNPF